MNTATQNNTAGCLPNQGNQGKIRELEHFEKNQGKIRELGQNLGKSGKNQGNYMHLIHIPFFLFLLIIDFKIILRTSRW